MLFLAITEKVAIVYLPATPAGLGFKHLKLPSYNGQLTILAYLESSMDSRIEAL